MKAFALVASPCSPKRKGFKGGNVVPPLQMHRAGRATDHGRRKTTLMESVVKKVSRKGKSPEKFGLIREDVGRNLNRRKWFSKRQMRTGEDSG